MMPTIMKEFDVLSQNVKNRPNFIANDNSISISIASNRIDITSDASAGDKMLNKDRFLEVAIKYIKEFFEIFQVGISRMSYIEEGIIKIIDNPDKTIPVEVYSDSNYVVETMNGHFAMKKNRDLWRKLMRERQKFTSIRFIWVKGHDKNQHNNDVDRQAVAESRKALEAQQG